MTRDAEPDRAGSTALTAALSDGPTLDLLLRLQRGKPRTTDQIREITPPDVDLSAALTALERAGLIRVEHDCLYIEAPEPIVASAASRELAEHRRRLAVTRDLVRTLGTSAAVTADADLPDKPADAVTLRFTSGRSEAVWAQVFAGVTSGVKAALPDARLVHGQLQTWLGSEVATPDPSSTLLLIGVRSLGAPAVRTLVDRAASRGVRVRLAGTVPSWLLLAPGHRGALSADEGRRPLSGMLTTEANLVVDALEATFDGWWTKGLPVPLTGGVVDKALALRTLSLSDDEIAAALDISTRTLQRQISQFTTQIGARSRFELGVWWATHRAGEARPRRSAPRRQTR